MAAPDGETRFARFRTTGSFGGRRTQPFALTLVEVRVRLPALNDQLSAISYQLSALREAWIGRLTRAAASGRSGTPSEDCEPPSKDTPAILVIPLESVDKNYLDWMMAETEPVAQS